MSILTILALVILSLPIIFLIYGLIQTILEKEKKASILLSIVLSFCLAVIAILLIWHDQDVFTYLVCSLALLFTISCIIILFPWTEKKLTWERGKPDQIDERNIMFSRAELAPGTERFDSYYKEFPEHKLADDAFRRHNGFMNEKGTFYNPWLFGAAEAAFKAVASFHNITDGPVSNLEREFNPDELTNFISNWAKELGVHSIGIAKLEKHHLYHTGGRSHNYGEVVCNSHKYAIAFTVEMDFKRVARAPRGPIVMESATQYLNSGSIAVQIAAFIRNMGYSARAHIDGKYQVRCPEVAKDAGLGEIGRMGLLMTPKLGPRVRLAVISTDVPLKVSLPRPDKSLLKFCMLCKKCAETCPSRAISFEDPKETGGTTQWVINQEACYTYWCKIGTDCGRCMAVCPYSHPDNLLHNTVRYLIRKSPLFRQIAIRLDNWLYGRKPPEKDLPPWMIPNSSPPE